MQINIIIENDGELVFSAECLSVESAIAELGKFERHVLPQLQDTETN